MHNRIAKLRDALNMSQTAFGSQIGLKKSAISLIESGQRSVSDQTLLLICREFNVSMDWLRTGEGEMFQQSAAQALGRKFSFRELTVHMLETFEKLTPEHQEIVLNYARQVVAGVIGPPGAPPE